MPPIVEPTHAAACVFCRLVAGEIPSARVYEDEDTLAFMDLGQVNPGHVLVALKRHAPTLLDCTTDEAAALMRTAHRVALAVRQAFDPPGFTLLQANGQAGDQTVFHLHMHVLPRHPQDGVDLAWPRKDPGGDALQAYAAQIRGCLPPPPGE